MNYESVSATKCTQEYEWAVQGKDEGDTEPYVMNRHTEKKTEESQNE